MAGFLRHHIKDENERKAFLSKAKEKLLEDGIEELIIELKSLKAKTQEGKKLLRKLLNYYQKHQKRMYYQSFQEKGYFISSGAIEAAHRHVLQQRLKLSGQRWTKDGFQSVANLRV